MWDKRRKKLDDMFRESRRLFGVYASWQNLINMPPVVSLDERLEVKQIEMDFPM